MKTRLLWLCCAVILAVSPLAQAQDAGRGRLLYENHCQTCHDAQVHWRAQKQVTSRASLLREVARWQSAANLGWSRQELRDTADYLNSRFYHLKEGP